MKKKCCLVRRCNFDQPQSSAGFASIFQGDVLLHSPVILWVQAARSLLDFVMLEKAGACGLSITHRISRQKLETPEDISFPQLKLCIYSRSYQLWFTTVHLREGGGGQDLQRRKPAGRNSCWNSQNRVFFPDIQHYVCFWQEFLSLVLIACLLQPSPYPSLPFISLCLLSSSLPCSSLLPFRVLDLVLSEPSSLPEALHLHRSEFCWTSSLYYSPSLPAPPSHPLLTKSSGRFLSSQPKHLAQTRPVLT